MAMAKETTAAKASLAWRKKPRKWAPKSRQGCKTCKLRRIKCDLAQPSCLKCSSTGRTCDGYNDALPAIKSNVVASDVSCRSSTIFTQKLDQRYAEELPHILQTIGPLMVLPVTGPAQAEALCFFEDTSIKHLNAYCPSQTWRDTLMFFSQTVPAVRYAALAVASVHRKYTDRDYGVGVLRCQYLKEWLQEEIPLLYYNRAIQLLLNQASGQDMGAIAITLLVCYLFICFDQLAGDDVRAVKHLSEGLKLLSSVDRIMLKNKDIYEEAISSEYSTLISQVRRQLHRLDMQAVQSIVVWRPVSLQTSFPTPCLHSDTGFHSLDEAAEHLQMLDTQVMRLRWCTTEAQPLFSAAQPQPSLSSLHTTVQAQLETWSRLFSNTLYHHNLPSPNPPTTIPLLRVQHLIASILLATRGAGREMAYDAFLPHFQQSIELAHYVVAQHEPHKPSFTPEHGILPILYIIAAKCRHPALRREAVTLLQRRPMREAGWESGAAARVVERIVEIEEGGGAVGAIKGMEDVPEWRRVEDVSWVNVATSRFAASMHLAYTFCGRGEVCMEVLDV